jgi:hypothetical protein
MGNSNAWKHGARSASMAETANELAALVKSTDAVARATENLRVRSEAIAKGEI